MNNFISIGIDKELQDKLKKQGIVEPTSVQKQSITAILGGNDVIVQAQTGTGKTLAFLLPIIQNIDKNKKYPQGLVLAPTRELALQITEDAKSLTEGTGIEVLAVYGGQDVEKQIRKLDRGMHLIVATPGRLLDHMRRGTLSLRGIDFLVLDEADEMIEMGFGQDVEKIVMGTTNDRRTMMFSATISRNLRNIGKRFMKNPAQIEIESENVTLDNIEQLGIRVEDSDKRKVVEKIIDEYNPFLMIVFCRTKERVTQLYNHLKRGGYNVDQIHGDISQSQRKRVMDSFRSADLQILIGTDIAARGIDVQGITHVLNYDMPFNTESYIHRIGRTGRIGNEGVALSLITPKDRDKQYQIEQDIEEKIKFIEI